MVKIIKIFEKSCFCKCVLYFPLKTERKRKKIERLRNTSTERQRNTGRRSDREPLGQRNRGTDEDRDKNIEKRDRETNRLRDRGERLRQRDPITQIQKKHIQRRIKTMIQRRKV